jgi:hypothetical protein
MKFKAFVVPALIASSLLANSQALAEHKLTSEQLAKARQSASQLNPPVDFDALIKEADRLKVVCTGDLTRGVRIAICEKKINNARKQEDIDRLEADTEATKQKTLEMVKDLQDFVNKNGK